MRRTGNHSKYERILEKFLRNQKITLIPTNEVRKSFDLSGNPIKSFDLMLLSRGLFSFDVKGKNFGFASAPMNKYENWIHHGDAEALMNWEKVFKRNGCTIKPLLVFMYKINFKGDEKLFKDVINAGREKYGVLAITPGLYLRESKLRSNNPHTISISRKIFKDLALPLSHFVPKLRF